ncbi:MAG: GNAT family N-acetyltransferase [Capnocytophaga ochracea]
MNENVTLRIAMPQDTPAIWAILSAAIERRKADGSNQWQDGYPNEEVIANDIAHQYGYVLTEGDEILGYVALLINNEPAYEAIKGKWLINADFMVFHRVAISPDHLGRGLAKFLLQKIEEIAHNKGIPSLRADTNFDNAPMLHLFEKLGYKYCGEVTFRGTPRKAFEKKL